MVASFFSKEIDEEADRKQTREAGNEKSLSIGRFFAHGGDLFEAKALTRNMSMFFMVLCIFW